MTTSEEKVLRDAAPFTDHCRSSAPSRCAAPQMAKCSNAPTARDEPVTLLTARKFAFLQGADMTDEADSHSPDTFDTAAEEPDSLTDKQRTRALYHFLDRVDVIIKKRCEYNNPDRNPQANNLCDRKCRRPSVLIVPSPHAAMTNSPTSAPSSFQALIPLSGTDLPSNGQDPREIAGVMRDGAPAHHPSTAMMILMSPRQSASSTIH